MGQGGQEGRSRFGLGVRASLVHLTAHGLNQPPWPLAPSTPNPSSPPTCLSRSCARNWTSWFHTGARCRLAALVSLSRRLRTACVCVCVLCVGGGGRITPDGFGLTHTRHKRRKGLKWCLVNAFELWEWDQNDDCFAQPWMHTNLNRAYRVSSYSIVSDSASYYRAWRDGI